MNNLKSEQRALLNLLGHRFFGAQLELEPDVDWEAIVKESMAQAVFSVTFNNYNELKIPEKLGKIIKKQLLRHALSNAECFKNHTCVHNIMVKNGIPYCTLKGAVSASYYPDSTLRSMGDVDFYVHPDNIDRALSIFLNEGFERHEGNHPSHIGLERGSMHLEMHFKPVAYHEGWIGEILEEYWSDIIDSATLSDTKLATYYRPSTFHHGFILLTHLQHHLYSEGVGLRHFLDFILFADSLSNDEFVDIFEAKLKRIGLWRLARLLCLAAVKNMGMEKKAWMGDDFDVADELLSDIIYGGNFGRKDLQRKYEGLFISDKNEGTTEKGRIRLLFKSLNTIVDYNWSSAKKIKILYPVGWVFFSMRYLVRVLLGKRKMNLGDTYQKSGKRREIYSKIKAFEPEI